MPSVSSTSPIETDALIIGAGPVGLFQVFELGLLGIRAHVLDVLPHAGGQCAALYGDKPIYDIPGIPRCTGHELTQRLLQQAAPFAPTFHFQQLVSQLDRMEDGRWQVHTQHGLHFLARTVFIAAGVGAFLPKAPKIEGSESLSHAQWHYQLGSAADYAGHHVLVWGDTDAALEAALALSPSGSHAARSVTLLHRRDVFQALPETVARFRHAVAAGSVQLCIGQPLRVQTDGSRITALDIATPEGTTVLQPCDTVLVLQGLSPKLGPVADWGLAMERKTLSVDTESFATSERGIFAVGDINTYPGKKKLILCGFHEATLAAFAAAHYLHPEQKTPLQYTTSSTLLQQRLDVL
jgi:thioredoxin reductase (NADPH)